LDDVSTDADPTLLLFRLLTAILLRFLLRAIAAETSRASLRLRQLGHPAVDAYPALALRLFAVLLSFLLRTVASQPPCLRLRLGIWTTLPLLQTQQSFSVVSRQRRCASASEE
jgi:hypothetical protein